MTERDPPSIDYRPAPRPPRPAVGYGRLLLVAAFCLLAGFYLSGRLADRGTPALDARPVTPRGSLSDVEKSTVALFKRDSPSVVYISTKADRRDPFGSAVREVPRGTGSGFVWDDAGHIVTNAHVVADMVGPGQVRLASSASVVLSDQVSYPARLVGIAPESDLAVLKIDAPAGKLHPITVGTSEDLEVGQSVFAIGNPFGLDQTLTTGVVSALGRTIQGLTGQPIDQVIQTDAAVNPGNSGGPLLDSAGRLIGVNTQIASPSGASAGIGFAISVDLVNRVVPQLIRDGKVVRPQIGVRFNQGFDREIRRQLGVAGLAVVKVEPGSAAEKAGLKPAVLAADGEPIVGDILQAVDGKAIATYDDFYAALNRHKPGETVTLTVWRNGATLKVPVTLEASQ